MGGENRVLGTHVSISNTFTHPQTYLRYGEGVVCVDDEMGGVQGAGQGGEEEEGGVVEDVWSGWLGGWVGFGR